MQPKIIDYNFNSLKIKGLCVNDTILINRRLETTAERECVIAEELGHYHLNCGNILDLQDTAKRKEELKAKRWAYRTLVSLQSLISAYDSGIQSRFELAEYLNVTEVFLQEAVDYYRIKYGIYLEENEYIICFEPLYIARRL
ncbi:MAG: ImmA/IrrE family metallo-endopeptidase [Bacillota bacterium]